jgi:hypothetical protein
MMQYKVWGGKEKKRKEKERKKERERQREEAERKEKEKVQTPNCTPNEKYFVIVKNLTFNLLTLTITVHLGGMWNL